MPRTCAASNCSAILHLFSFPEEPTRREAWIKFVKALKPSFVPKKHNYLCWRHFEVEDFLNWTGYKEGIHNK